MAELVKVESDAELVAIINLLIKEDFSPKAIVEWLNLVLIDANVSLNLQPYLYEIVLRVAKTSPVDDPLKKSREHLLKPGAHRLLASKIPSLKIPETEAKERAAKYIMSIRKVLGDGFLTKLAEAQNQVIPSHTSKEVPPGVLGSKKTADTVREFFRDRDPLSKELEAFGGRIESNEEKARFYQIQKMLSNDLIANEIKRRIDGESFEIIGRDSQVRTLIDSFVRLDAPVPTVLAEIGAGKSTLIDKFVSDIIDAKYPNYKHYIYRYDKIDIVKLSARDLMIMSPQALPAQIGAITKSIFENINIILNQEIKRKVLIVVDDIHFLPTESLHYLAELHKTKYISILGVGSSEAFNAQISRDLSVKNRFKPLNLLELERVDVEQILEENWVGKLESYYKLKFDDSVIPAIVDIAQIIHKDLGLLNASLRYTQDVAMEVYHQKMKSKSQSSRTVRVTKKQVYDLMVKELNLPVNPFNSSELMAFEKKLIADLKETVLGQDRMIEDTTKLFTDLLLDKSRGIRTAMLIGPTGVGKTELGLAISKRALNNSAAFLELDGNAYKDKTTLNTLTGSGLGYVGSSIGVLGEFFLNEARGANTAVLLINEFEKAHEDLAEKLMEFFDKQKIQLGNGSEVGPKKVLVLLTSNRADHLVYPSGSELWSEAELDKHLESFTPDKVKELFTQSKGSDSAMHNSVINRIDLFTLARPMTKELAIRIANEKVIVGIQKTVLTDYGIHFKVDEEVVENLVLTSFKAQDGARPIINDVKRKINEALLKARSQNDWNLEAGSRLRVKMGKNNKTIDVFSGRKKVSVPARNVPESNPYKDKALIAKLMQLKEKLNDKISGQIEANSSIADSIMAHLLSPRKNQALSIFLVGTSGSGKTETGKVISEHLFQSSERVGFIPLGEIDSKEQWGKFFGVEPGYKGGDKVRVFEQFLIDNPGGGLMLFDEASNMGGNDKSLKEALFKKLYALNDEKHWRSPNTGDKYDLSKYVFIYTGNDGQELFYGHTTDDMRSAIYEDNKDRQKLLDLLRSRGVPEAFLGRLADVILTQPLMQKDILKVVRKLVAPVFENFKNNDLNISFSKDFYEQFGKSFFRATKGGRSIREVAEIRLKSAIDKQILPFLVQKIPLENLKVQLSLRDNLPDRPYRPNVDWHRQVEFVISIREARKLISTEVVDVTAFAPTINLSTKRSVTETGYHEAGHAIVNDPKLTGSEVGFITVVGADNFLGYVRWENLAQYSGKLPDKKAMLMRIAAIRAGGLAQKLAGFPIDAGWSNDMEKVSKALVNALVKYNLDPRVRAIAIDLDGKYDPSPKEKELIRKVAKEWLDEADKIALKSLTENWHIVRNTVRVLLEKGSISGPEFKEIKQRTAAEEIRLSKQGAEILKWHHKVSSNPAEMYESLLMKKVNISGKEPKCKVSF